MYQLHVYYECNCLLRTAVAVAVVVTVVVLVAAAGSLKGTKFGSTIVNVASISFIALGDNLAFESTPEKRTIFYVHIYIHAL